MSRSSAGAPPRHPLIPDHPADAFAGTAEYYDRFRVPYPAALFDDLNRHASLSGQGRLLDLACGTGQIALPLSARFRQVWALDREPGMIEVGRRRAAAQSVTNLEWRLGRAEDLEAPAGAFELITIGNAFHRLHRRLIGHRAQGWLGPTGCLSVLGSNSLWTGTEDWQAIARDVVRAWQPEQPTAARPLHSEPRESFEEALRHAGFGEIDSFQYRVPKTWLLDDLVGYLYSLSGVSKHVLGAAAAPFERDLRRALLTYDGDGLYREVILFYMILSRPVSLAAPDPL